MVKHIVINKMRKIEGLWVELIGICGSGGANLGIAGSLGSVGMAAQALACEQLVDELPEVLFRWYPGAIGVIHLRGENLD